MPIMSTLRLRACNGRGETGRLPIPTEESLLVSRAGALESASRESGDDSRRPAKEFAAVSCDFLRCTKAV